MLLFLFEHHYTNINFNTQGVYKYIFHLKRMESGVPTLNTFEDYRQFQTDKTYMTDILISDLRLYPNVDIHNNVYTYSNTGVFTKYNSNMEVLWTKNVGTCNTSTMMELADKVLPSDRTPTTTSTIPTGDNFLVDMNKSVRNAISKSDFVLHEFLIMAGPTDTYVLQRRHF